MVALAAGCGGASGPNGGGSTGRQAAVTGPATAAAPQVTDGRVGDAVVARPGKTEVTGHAHRITARAALPHPNKNALGAEANCADADAQPTQANLAHVSDVIFCLMNAMREDNGLPDLAQESALAKASVDHSQDMVDNKYFAHDSPDGRDVVARLTAVSYIPVNGDWVVGENLAWGSGALATPRALVDAWMNSPPHRANLLSGDFKQVGMGVVLGTPSADADQGVTVTTDFGTRFPSSVSATADVGAAKAATTRARARKARSRCMRRRGASRRRCLKAASRLG